MRIFKSPLVRFFKRPDLVHRYSIGDWDVLVREARHAGLLARLHQSLLDSGLWESVPRLARWHFEAAATLAARQRVAVCWEIGQLHAALADLDVPCVLLKGAAYVAIDAPAAVGRLFNDIDLMVPKAALDQAEMALKLGGWHMHTLSAYDERYYRRWMHEIPPLRHLKRGSVLDLHHAILPTTTRRRPDTDALLARLEPLTVYPGLHVLCEEDRILHSAAHLFHDGELPHGLRDLSDIDLLLRKAAIDPDFWPRLLARAVDLRVERSLYYALRYAGYFFDTPIPEEHAAELARHAPPWPLRRLADAVFRRALTPDHPDSRERWHGLAKQIAYVRAHALRMPMRLLVPHLLHKAFVSPWLDPDKAAKTAA